MAVSQTQHLQQWLVQENLASLQLMKNAVDNDAQGPPDRNSDFKRLSRKRKATDDSSVPDKMVCIRIQRYYPLLDHFLSIRMF